MAVANLFKDKAHFQLRSEEDDRYEPCVFNKGRQYISNEIENLESIGVSNVSELRLKCLEPFIYYILSSLIDEEYSYIDSVTATVTLIPRNRECDYYDLVEYELDNPWESIHLFSSSNEMRIYSFPDHLLNATFCIYVNFYSYFLSNEDREEAFLAEHGISHAERDRMLSEIGELASFFLGRNNNNNNNTNNNITISEPLPPPIETYRQEKCVICLEASPSILYLDCMHIAVCVPCDRVKSKTSIKSTCDVCRAEISKRIKI